MSLEETITKLRSLPVPPNEESTKAQFIQPVLRLLGWPSEDPARVFFEYGAGSGRVDIALRTSGRFVVFVEAKAPGKNLGDHVSQMLQYAFHEGVDICVLTTGLKWWLFLPREKGRPMDRRFAVLDIGKGPARQCADLLHRYLGRDALASRSAERSAKDALRALKQRQRLEAEIPEVWKEMRTKPDPDLLVLIATRVNEKTGLTATGSQIAKVLGMAEPPAVVRSVRPQQEVAKSLESGTGQTRKPPAPIRSYRLWGVETSVKTWKDMLVGVFLQVHARHGVEFLTTARPLWGKRSPWVSSDPEELRKPQSLGQTGLYAETNLNAKDIQRRCHRLLKTFGYSDGDLEILKD